MALGADESGKQKRDCRIPRSSDIDSRARDGLLRAFGVQSSGIWGHDMYSVLSRVPLYGSLLHCSGILRNPHEHGYDALVLVEALRDQQTLEENSYNTRGLVPARRGL